MFAGVPLPLRLLRNLQAGAVLILPSGAQAHVALLAAGQCHAHVPLRPAPGVQLHGWHCAATWQELLSRQRRDGDCELLRTPLLICKNACQCHAHVTFRCATGMRLHAGTALSPGKRCSPGRDMTGTLSQPCHLHSSSHCVRGCSSSNRGLIAYWQMTCSSTALSRPWRTTSWLA